MSTKFYLIYYFFCVLIIQGSSGVEDDLVNVSTDGPETSTLLTTLPADDNVVKKKTTTTTTTPITTTPTTTNTTPQTTTTPTTTTPTTTTPSKTTSQTTTSMSTTPPPSTTTVAPSTTSAPPAPKPLPEPEVGSWVLSNSTTNLTCVIIHMALRMKIPYDYTQLNQDHIVQVTQEWGLLNLPKNANFTGTCDEFSVMSNVSQVRLWWGNNTNYLDITFKRYNESKAFNITRLYLTQNVSGDAFPNNTLARMVNFQGNGSGLFEVATVPLGSSYRCSHKVNVNLTELNASTPSSAILSFSKVQIQAFVNTTSGTFGGVYDCPGMDTSDIVPIAVGCALAGLVIGVLIAYLVGRRRSHARGYLSM